MQTEYEGTGKLEKEEEEEQGQDLTGPMQTEYEDIGKLEKEEEEEKQGQDLTGYLILWLVGDADETKFIWDFIFEKMTEVAYNSDINMSGTINLGQSTFKMAIFIMRSRHLKWVSKGPKFEPDGVIVCQNSLNLSSTDQSNLYQNWHNWGHLKALGFLNPTICPSIYHCFLDKKPEQDFEKDLEDFCNTMKLPKEIAVLKRTKTFRA